MTLEVLREWCREEGGGLEAGADRARCSFDHDTFVEMSLARGGGLRGRAVLEMSGRPTEVSGPARAAKEVGMHFIVVDGVRVEARRGAGGAVVASGHRPGVWIG